jgi:hypothetical protein
MLYFLLTITSGIGLRPTKWPPIQWLRWTIPGVDYAVGT